MVSNTSSLGEDISEIGSAISGAATDVGQFFGLVDEDLIPGDAAETGEIATHLTKLGEAFERAGDGFKKIDTGSWHGEAADAARAYLDTAWPKWLKASDCFADAGRAVADYQRVLAESQQKAARAKADLERAQQASEAAREAYNARVDAYNAAALQASNNGGTPPTPPGSFRDPAAGDIAAAEQAIKQAQDAVAAAGDRAAAAVLAATNGAPAEPGLLTQLKENLIDNTQAGLRTLGSIGAGAVGAVVDLAKLTRTIAPLDPYRITHPAQASENMATLAMGVVGAVQNPYGAIKTVVDIDGWKNDPARTLGSCIPDAIASIAGGAGAASRVARTFRKLTKRTDDLGHGATHADDVVRGTTQHPNPPSPPPSTPSAPNPPNTQWGRWPEPSPQPNVPTATHPEPSAPHPAPLDRGLDSAGNPYQPPAQHDGFVRPSEMTTPGGHHPGASPEMPPGRDVPGPHARPELHDSHGWPDRSPEASPGQYAPDGQHAPEPPSPEQRINDALAQVREHGDGQKFDDRYDFEPGTKDLPEGLSRDNPDPFGNDAWQRPRDFDAPEFIHRNVDPSDEANALWRAVHSQDLDELFRHGLAPRDPDARADIKALEGHVGGNTTSRFVSATDSLEHALQRALNRPDDYGTILKFRTGGGIDVDATLHDYLGDSPFGYASHGENEFLLKDGAHPSIIEGAYRPISFDGTGKPTGYEWVPNPYFDESMLRKGAR